MTTGSPEGDRTSAKRRRLVETAMRHFAERGYQGARVEDISAEVGIAKGSVFRYFGTKEGLFLAAYRAAVRSFAGYLDVPEPIRRDGFFAIARYWLERTEHLIHEDWIPYRVTLLGDYGSDLPVRREINRFLTEEDPYGTMSYVRFGIERGEVRDDIDPAMIASLVEWTMDRFQDALVTEELDPGLFRRQRDGAAARRRARIDQFLELLSSAIGTDRARRRGRPAKAAV